MTVCVIGNSHAGSLLKAFNTLPDARRLGWAFYSAADSYRDNAGLNAIAYDAKRGAFLDFPYHRGNHGPNAVIGAYDCFVLVGAHPSAARIARWLNQELSDRFRAAAVAEICRYAPLDRFVRIIRKTSSARILLVTRPAPSRDKPVAGADAFATEDLIAGYWATRGVELVRPPAELMTSDGMTRPAFHKPNDNQHYNPEGAMLALTAVRAAINAPRAVRTP